MNRRSFLRTLAAFFASSLFAPLSRAQKGTAYRIAFGSCANQSRPQPIWSAVAAQNPGLFICLGDNIYADTMNPADFAEQYALLKANADFSSVRGKFPLVATWDDHDMGRNDGGGDYPFKRESKQAMLDFFGEPKESERRAREGVYESYFLLHGNKRVQVILLDLRWFRSDPGADGAMLGETQWKWLEEQLQQPAHFRILGSSIQLVSAEHIWEKWANFPREKARLYQLLDQLDVRNFLVISGDMHIGELSRETTPGGIPVHDLTSSGLNMGEALGDLPNSKRLQFFDDCDNFGLLTFDWDSPLPTLLMEVRDASGARITHEISL
ncbi:MAG TPA: alkaline phosphatase D family protein [Bdellovibrionota bacterium]|jgi:alkaline phosphatase D